MFFFSSIASHFFNKKIYFFKGLVLYSIFFKKRKFFSLDFSCNFFNIALRKKDVIFY